MCKTLAPQAVSTGGCSPTATSMNSCTNAVGSTRACRWQIFERATISQKKQKLLTTLPIFPHASAKGCQKRVSDEGAPEALYRCPGFEPRDPSGFKSRNPARIWRDIPPEKSHPCSREF